MESFKKNRVLKNAYRVEGIEERNEEVIKNMKEKAILEEIIHIIEQSPEILKKLDVHKLEVIDKYYKDKIAKIKRKKPN